MAEYKLSYTASKIDEKLGMVDINSENIGKMGGTVEITSGAPAKENTVLTLNPDANGVNVYTAEEVDSLISNISNGVVEETDPTVPSWAKQPNKPTYTASEVGADPSGTAESKVSAHNTSDASHNDIRLLINGLTTRLNTLANSDDTTLDQMAELVDYIKSNRSLIEQVTTNKINVSDIIDNLTTNVSNKPLSAKQGVALKALIDAIKVPTKLSELTEDSTHRVVTDSEKQTWNEIVDHKGNTLKHLIYGICNTSADDANKIVTVSDDFELTAGAVIIVKFTNANSIASPTLNVNGTGAKPMYRYGTTAVSTATTTTGWTAGAVQMFIYDGVGWIRDYWSNTTYSNAALGHGYGTCSTAASTTAKTVSLSSYSLTTGGSVTIKFSNAVPANATLNINSKGAKAIYYKGAKIKDGVIKAGDIVTFVYSSYYHLISIDRWQDDISKKADKATTLSGYGITDGATKTELNALSDAKASQSGWAPNMLIGTDANGNMVARATYTEAEKQALIQEVVDSIKVIYPEAHVLYGDVDENNHITLFGSLEDGEYTLQYEDADGESISEIVRILVSNGTEVKPSYTNIIPTCVAYNSTEIYNGKGWKENTRWSANSNAEKTAEGTSSTGFFVVRHGDVIRLKNITFNPVEKSDVHYMCGYNLDFSSGWGCYGFDAINEIFDVVMDDNNITQLTYKQEGTFYYILCATFGADAIITINEEIIEDSTLPYTNQIPISIDTDGSVFNATGYMENKRINSSGVVSDLSNANVTNPAFVTGLIPIKQGDIIRFKNCYIDSADIDNSSKYGTAGWSLRVAQYNEIDSTVDGGEVGLVAWNNFTTDTTSAFIKDVVLDGNGYVTQFTIKQDTKKYIQLTLACDGSPADAIVTVNEEIPEDDKYTNWIPLAINSGGTIVNGQGWETGYRLNSSGDKTALDGMEVTGYIPVKYGDVVRMKNIGWNVNSTSVGELTQVYLWCYDSSFNAIAYALASGIVNTTDATFDANGNLIKFTANYGFFYGVKQGSVSDMAYIRLSCQDISSSSILTVNEEITGNFTFNVPITWILGTKLSKTDGTVESTGVTNYNASDYILLENGVSYTLSTMTDSYNTMSVCYYDDSNTMISYQADIWSSTETAIEEGNYHSIPLVIPEGATKIRLRQWETWKTQGNSHQYIKLTGTTSEDEENTNQIPLSTDTDGSIYNEVGYKNGVRLNTSASELEADGMAVTGFIPCKPNDTLYFKNIITRGDNSTGWYKLQFYDANKTSMGMSYFYDSGTNEYIGSAKNYDAGYILLDGDGYLTKIVLALYNSENGTGLPVSAGTITSDFKYVRVVCGTITDESIITVNKPMSSSQSETIPINWEIGLKLGKTDNNHSTVTVTPGVENLNSYSASQVISYDENAVYTLGINEAYEMRVSVCCYDVSGNNIGYLENICGGADNSTAIHEATINAPTGTATIRLRYSYMYNGTDLGWYHGLIWLKKTNMD